MKKNSRNFGIDFLRILAMFYVVVLHTLGRGGILGTAEIGTHQYMVSWFLEIWAYCAVDIFALVSGYVGYHEEERPVKFRNYISLWMQVVFYGIVVTLIFNLFHPELVTKLDLIEMMFPVTNGLYWYFTAYTGLFFCMPLLNTAMTKCSKNLAVYTFIILFLMFSVYDTFVGRFVLNGGYSFVWLVILYLFGSILKKCEIGKKIRSFEAIAGIFFLAFLTWLWKIYGVEWSFMKINITPDTFVSYTSPTVLGSAILYIIGFSKIQFKYLKKIITFAAPSTFAAYILNDQRFVKEHMMYQKFSAWSGIHSYIIPAKVFAFAGAFVVCSIFFDKVRDRLFQLFRIHHCIAYIEKKLNAVIKYNIKTNNKEGA